MVKLICNVKTVILRIYKITQPTTIFQKEDSEWLDKYFMLCGITMIFQKEDPELNGRANISCFVDSKFLVPSHIEP